MTNRRQFLAQVAAGMASGAGQPNIIWITAEDLSPTLGCYGDQVAVMPNLDRLAQEGIRYTSAFTTAPVCSASRSCLITGAYQTALGTHQHRSRIPVRSGVRGFPALLREAGYYCTNNAKTDYNLRDEPGFVRDCWDRSDRKAHWRGRSKGQPFFSVFNFEITHQSRTCAWPYAKFEEMIREYLRSEERTRPDAVSVPPYFPDTPIVRRTIAREYDCQRALDQVYVGRVLRELEEDGLLEDTIVFFFSDHGSGLPRHKRVLYDSGLRVPLIVRFPKKFRSLAPAPAGSAIDHLVSFVDLAPSVLNLAGMAAPAFMQGQPFLGPNRPAARHFVFGARDRIDEAFDFSRSVRDERWLYLRHYHPHVPWSQPEYYSREEEIRLEIARLDAERKLNKAQKAFTSEKPIEELFDTRTDPHQVRNLADAPEHRAVLERMRSALQEWMSSNRDLGFVPEEEIFSMTRRGPVAQTPEEFRHRIAVANGIGNAGRLKESAQHLSDPDPAARFWAVVNLRVRVKEADFADEALCRSLRDPQPSVRLEACSTLAAMHEELPDGLLDVLARELESDNLVGATRAARILWSFGDRARPKVEARRAALDGLKARESKQPEMQPYFFALQACLNAALDRLGKGV
ncbi:MAG: sulfatase-like hydrolase/transferase [Acidobacteria bacterium]|nr:sulfatase-like hydrolase/transferase [Acidobacteriota bacterium]